VLRVHGRRGAGATEYDAFCANMLAAFEEAERDPDGFVARHRPQRASAEQGSPEPSRPSEAEGAIDGWARAFAKASGMPRS
jgi:hypothetical protein